MTKRIFISADHGMAIIYFLQSDVIPTLLNAGIEVILLTDDAIVAQLASRFTVLHSKASASNKPTTMPKKFNPASNGSSPTCAASAVRAASTPKPWTVTFGKCGRKTVGSFVWGFGFPPR